jgi:hypothetical protein
MFGRALSTLAAMLFVCVMAAIGRRVGLVRWQWLGIAAAGMPGVVWAAAELRGYALILLLVALVTYFYLGIVRGTGRVAGRDAFGYVVAATALLYTFYYGGFVLIGQWLGALIARRRVAPLTGLLAIVGCLLLPMVSEIRTQVAVHPVEAVHIDLATNARFAIFKTVGVIVGAFGADADILSWAHVMLIALVIAIGVPIVRTVTGRRPWDREEAALTVAAAIPVIVLAMLRILNTTPVQSRHVLVALPGILLIYGVWMQRLADGWPRMVTGAVIAVATLVCLVSFEGHNVQREDWRGAARYVAAHAVPGDVTLVYDPDRVLPFSYYVPASVSIPVYSVPVDINLERYDPDAYAIRDTAIVAARLQSLGILDHSLWFVTATQLLEPLEQSPAIVLRYLSAHDRLDPPVSLDGVRIVHGQPR